MVPKGTGSCPAGNDPHLLGPSAAEQDRSHPVERSHDHREKKHQACFPQPEPCRQHGQELHVAHPHAHPAPGQPVGSRDQQQHRRRHGRGQQRQPCRAYGRGPGPDSALQAGTQPGKHDSRHQSRQGKPVGQQQGLRIHHRQPQQQEAEQCPERRQPAERKVQATDQEKDANGKLDQRIAPGDAAAALSAGAAKQQPAQHGNVIPVRYRLIALAAVRPRPHHGFAGRQPHDADVEKATQQQTE